MAHTGIASTQQYNYEIIKKFAVMALVWGLLGMTAGVYIASELAWPFLNFDIPEITFGRLRPVHTTLVIFGFGGSALFATSYYVVQRTCQTRLISRLAWPALPSGAGSWPLSSRLHSVICSAIPRAASTPSWSGRSTC